MEVSYIEFEQCKIVYGTRGKVHLLPYVIEAVVWTMWLKVRVTGPRLVEVSHIEFDGIDADIWA
jgi:hypothetical protein